MSSTIMLHLIGEEAMLCEVERLPSVSDTNLTVMNLRKRDGKDASFLEPNVSSVIIPLSRINFIEVMSSGETEEEIVGFVRD
jgi:hypothetical protein